MTASPELSSPAASSTTTTTSDINIKESHFEAASVAKVVPLNSARRESDSTMPTSSTSTSTTATTTFSGSTSERTTSGTSTTTTTTTTKLKVVYKIITLSYVAEAMRSAYGQLYQIAADDKRKVIHAFKVALALNLTALYILFNHADDLTAHNGIWAVMTVVVIFEFTAGATYCKGLNRAVGTFLAGVLVLGLSQLAMVGGPRGQIIVICISILFVGAGATFLRFVPKVKARYDYGMLVFLLTFSLLMISSTPSRHPIDIALSRLYMVSVGCSISLFTTTFIYPVWAGDEIHTIVSKNFIKLASALENSVDSYLDPKPKPQVSADSDPIYKQYNSLFTSRSNEESLVNFAAWEPPHGRFKMLKYPWQEYVKVGTALRHCAYTAMALHGCVTSQAKGPIHLKERLHNQINQVKEEVNSVLCELGYNLRMMQRNRPAKELLRKLNETAQELQHVIDQHSTLFVNINFCFSAKSKPNRLLDGYDGMIPHSGPILSTPPFTNNQHSLHQEQQQDKVFHSGPLTFNMESKQQVHSFSVATFVFLLMETTTRIKGLVEAVDKLAIAANFQEVCTEQTCKSVVIDIQ